jgi:hypothetical protein
MIVSGILWLLTWPVVIGLSYFLIRFVLNKVDKNLEEVE